MKTKLTSIICVAIFFIFAFKSYAQMPMGTGAKVMLESGSLTEIKKEKNLNIQYDYTSFAVGKFKTEEDYVRTKVEEISKKDKAKAEKWKASWVNARKTNYEPKFLALLNKSVAKSGAKYSDNSKAKYTLIVKTTFLEPGYNIGIAKYPSFCNFDFIFVETDNPENVVCKLYVQNVIGANSAGFDYDVSSRVQESYAKAGKMLGGYIMKKK